MRAIYLSQDELQTIRDTLEAECSKRLEEFDRSKLKTDLLSQRRAVRAAKDARRLHNVLVQIDDYLKESIS